MAGKVLRHISAGAVPKWESQNIALGRLRKDSTHAPEKWTMAVRFRPEKRFWYEYLSHPAYPESRGTYN